MNIQRKNMVDGQIAPIGLVSEELLSAFLSVERTDFLPDTLKAYAYEDRNLEYNGNLILKPMFIAYMLQAADIQANEKVLYVSHNKYGAEVLRKITNNVVFYEEIVHPNLYDVIICESILPYSLDYPVKKTVGIVSTPQKTFCYKKDSKGMGHVFDLLIC